MKKVLLSAMVFVFCFGTVHAGVTKINFLKCSSIFDNVVEKQFQATVKFAEAIAPVGDISYERELDAELTLTISENAPVKYAVKAMQFGSSYSNEIKIVLAGNSLMSIVPQTTKLMRKFTGVYYGSADIVLDDINVFVPYDRSSRLECAASLVND